MKTATRSVTGSNEAPRPNIDFENPNYISSLYKEDASFLRIGQVTLGYTLPKALLQNVGIQKLRVYATVQNAYVFTGYSGTDPESGGDFKTDAEDVSVWCEPELLIITNMINRR